MGPIFRASPGAHRWIAVGSVVLLLAAGCAQPGEDTATQRGPSRSWAPAVRELGGLRAIAQADERGYRLFTQDAQIGFLSGVNLGSTVPGRLPGELEIARAEYRRWFVQMGELGIRTVRVYTIHPPGFYEELLRYNRANPDAPLYLVQGVYLPDEFAYIDSGDLFEPGPTEAFTQELRDAVAAVFGDLQRGSIRGRASGRWSADVSPWVAAWIVGVEWDPHGTFATNRNRPDAPPHIGEFFENAADASPVERWIAARMDETASALAARGWTVPLAFVNWPTVDPLDHPEEPLDSEDLVGVDANHVRATAAWPGGTFASYHAYPYYPDFLRHEPGLQEFRYGDRADPYAGYLNRLLEHHDPMPVMVTETGVPSSNGTAHFGPLGRGQGSHAEEEAMRINAELLLMIRDLGLAGALLFEWTDEWFKHTWNTQPRHIPFERRQLWHDPWTNEQYFGLVATDPLGPADQAYRVLNESRAGIREVAVRTDQAWVYVRVRTDDPLQQLRLGFDVVPGGLDRMPGSEVIGGSYDYAVTLDPATREGKAWVRPGLDGVVLDLPEPPALAGRPSAPGGWLLHQLTVNRSLALPTTGEVFPIELFDVGVLREGEVDPSDADYDSLATWQAAEGQILLRLPWLALGVTDPSSKTALSSVAGGVAQTLAVQDIGLVVESDRDRTEGTIAWEPWQGVDHEERLKAGAEQLAGAFRELAP